MTFSYLAPLPVMALTLACGGESDSSTSSPLAFGDEGSEQTVRDEGDRPDPPGNLPNLSADPLAEPEDEPDASAHCSFLELSDCFMSAQDQLMACLDAGRLGTFSEDGLSCVFEEAGGVVEFDEPFPKGRNGFELKFRIVVDGEECAAFSESYRNISGDEDITELRTQDHSATVTPTFERTYRCDGVEHTLTAAQQRECVSDQPFVGLSVVKEADFRTGRVRLPLPGGGSRNVFTCTFPE